MRRPKDKLTTGAIIPHIHARANTGGQQRVAELTTDHDTDIVAWAKEQAQALRVWAPRVEIVAGKSNQPGPDWRNIIEEIEELARSHRRELASRISTILVHLIKLQASPAIDPRPGWRSTIRTQRAEIDRLLTDAPSLRPIVPDIIVYELPIACVLAAGEMADYGETPKVEASALSYTPDQVLNWFPD